MIARAYRPEDFEALKELCGGKLGDLDPAADVIVVVEYDGHLVGAIAFREALFVHELAIEGALAHRIGELACAYAMGAARAMGKREAYFTVDPANTRAQRFVEGQKAVKQAGIIYSVEVR